jgi:hypothetical protein
MVSIEQCLQINAPIRRCFDLSRSIEVHLPGQNRRASKRPEEFLRVLLAQTTLSLGARDTSGYTNT